MKSAEEIVSVLATKTKSATALKEIAQELLWLISKELEASQAAFFISEKREGIRVLRYMAGYAYHIPETKEIIFEYGEGLAGQVAKEGKPVFFNNVPEGYISILSGLGQASPTSMAIFPILINTEVRAVMEIASFKVITESEVKELEKLLSGMEKTLEKYLAESK